MKLTFGKLLAFILLPLLFLLSCSRYKVGDLQQLSEERIWKSVSEKTGTIQDFKGDGEIILESGFKTIPVRAKIWFKTPDWLTIRTFGPMGLKLIEASLQKHQFQVYSPFTNEFINGSLDSVNLSTRFRLPIPNFDLREAWCRLFNRTQPQSDLTDIRRVGKYYILSYKQNDVVHEIWVNAKKMLIERENLLDSTNVIQGYFAYSRYKKKSGVRFPRQIEIGDIPRGVKLTITTRKFKVNSQLSDTDLILSVPPNANRINLNSGNF